METIDYSIRNDLTVDGYCAEETDANCEAGSCTNYIDIRDSKKRDIPCLNTDKCKKQKEERKHKEKQKSLCKLWRFSRAIPGTKFYDNLTKNQIDTYYPIYKNGHSMMGSHTFEHLRPDIRDMYQRQWANLWYRRFASQQGSTVDGWPATQLTGSDRPYISMGNVTRYTEKDYYHPRCCNKKSCSNGTLMCYKRWKATRK